MRAGLLLAGVAILGIGGAASAEDDDSPLPPGGPRRTPQFQARVDLAIERGVEWLRSVQGADGTFTWDAFGGGRGAKAYAFGTTSLGVHTLRSCGAAANDPAVASGVARMRMLWGSGHGQSTYEAALGLLALEALHAAPSKGARRPNAGGIPDNDRAWARSMAGFLVRCQSSNGSFGYGPGGDTKAWTDHSNAQYGLLGLKAARRLGIELKSTIFRRALDHFLAAQEADGPVIERRREGGLERPGRTVGTTRAVAKDRARGWGYQGPDGPTGSMTTGGISSLVICRGELMGTQGWTGALDGRTVQAIRDGIAWVGRNFSVRTNPTEGGGGGGWHHYYLYGLERAGVLAGVAWMGDHDWYGEGAEQLIRTQGKNGGWGAGMSQRRRKGGQVAAISEGDLLDTCFALLFLKKATFRVDGAVATEEVDEALDLASAATLDDAGFRDVFQVVFDRFRRAKPDKRAALATDFVVMGSRALPLLVQRLEDEEEASRAAAIEALERVTGGETLGFRAADESATRGKAVAAWEEWWFSRRGRLIADPKAGRFR
ncbi:MAG TPA: hypothetical protein VFS92_06785 [Planctomycetota bacterium]|nr:hypothetical protein [Planctomycetota bacterium]